MSSLWGKILYNWFGLVVIHRAFLNKKTGELKGLFF